MSNLHNVGASTSSEGSQKPLEVDKPVESPKVSHPFDIQAGSCVKISPENLIELKKGEKVESLPGKKKKCCKVLKFSSEWKFQDAINEISRLNPFNYPNFFVSIIEAKYELEVNSEPYHEQEKRRKIDDEPVQSVKKRLEEKFSKFLKSRQILIQLTEGSENKIKSFHNQTDLMEKLHEVTWGVSEVESNDEFLAFLRNFLRLQHESPAEKFENAIFDLLKNPDELSLRFLTIFDFSFDFSFQVSSYCAAKLSKSHFFAAIGLKKFEDGLTKAQAKMISSTFEDYEYESILEAALAGENIEIIKYLIKFCGYLIERLPKEHQIEVANQLVENNKFDILCDLLTNCDFLFPTEINLTDIDHRRFKSIVAERQELHEAIKNENYEYKINDFREGNPYLAIAYNINNESALYTAVKNDKVNAFRYLKEKGFLGTENDLDDLRFNLMLLNVESNAFNPEKVIDLLASCSRVYGNKTDYSVYLGKIRKWLTAIYRTEFGGHLLSAAAQCGNLTIVFDFNRSDVESVDLDSKDADGIMYHEADLVIIAAKHLSFEKEQRIKGVLAHELTHFVIRKLFDNEEQPYLNDSDERFEKYRKVVKKYENLKNEGIDDKCEGIISSVYQDYNEEDFDAELIVRAFQIQARYDDNPTKVAQLEVIYEDLFDFVRDELLDVMKHLNMKEMEVVKKFNKYSGHLSKICKLDFNFQANDIIKILLNKMPTIVTTNGPKLFFADIYCELRKTDGNLVEAKNIFLTQDRFLDEDYLDEFTMIVKSVKEVTVFLDFSLDENFQVMQNLTIPANRNFVFIVSNENQSKILTEILLHKRLKPQQETKKYEWNGLTKEIQKFFLEYEMNFQNHSKVSLLSLFGDSRDLNHVMDAELLNKMLNNSEISVNANLSMTRNDHFEHLNIERKFLKNYEEKFIPGTHFTYEEIMKMQVNEISQQEFIKENENEKFVLISDLAGSGKSWAMRSLALEMSSMKKGSWVTFVDLKFHFKFFEHWNKEPSMYDFIIEEVLKQQTNVEKEIFNLKYQKGQAAIFFDGCDEIVPDSTEFVLKLMKSFMEIEGNQLYISTRDFFEIDLKKELNVRDAYKLDMFDSLRGVELISRIWCLHDLKSSRNIDLSDAWEKYQTIARNLIFKVENYSSGFGSPQILQLSMIGELTKEKKELDESLNIFQLYDKMWNKIYKEWESEKGPARQKEGSKNQGKDLNFQKLHELIAIQRFNPKKASYCDLDPASIKHDWKGVSIDGCGLLTKIVNEYYFIHKTFYEFFVVKFILRNLRYTNPKRMKEAFEFMQEIIMKARENRVIIRLLDEGLSNEKSEVETSNSANIFDDQKEERLELLAEGITSTFEEEFLNVLTDNLLNLDTLSDLVVEIFVKKDKEKFKKFLGKELTNQIERDNRNEESQRILIDLILSRIDFETISEVAQALNNFKKPTFIKELVQFNDDKGENIYFRFTESRISSIKQFDKFMEFLKRFLSLEEIAEKTKELDKKDETVFHQCSICEGLYKAGIFLEGFGKFFEYSLDDFKDILAIKNKEGSTFLHLVADHHFTFDENFWSSLMNVFKNDRDLLMELILQLDSKARNFFHILKENFGHNSLRIALNQVSRALSKDQIREILKSKTEKTKENLLCYELIINTEKVLRNFLMDSVETKGQLLEILTDADIYGNNYLHRLLSTFLYDEDWLHNRLEDFGKFLSREELKTLIKSNLNKFGQNFLQYAVLFDNKLKWLSCEDLWIIIRKYFDPSEIIDLVKHRDIFGYNFLQIILQNSDKSWTESTSNEIIKIITENKFGDEKSVDKLKKAIERKLTEEDEKILSVDWIDTGNPLIEVTEVSVEELKQLFLHENHKYENIIKVFYRNGNTKYLEPILQKLELEMDG